MGVWEEGTEMLEDSIAAYLSRIRVHIFVPEVQILLGPTSTSLNLGGGVLWERGCFFVCFFPLPELSFFVW